MGECDFVRPQCCGVGGCCATDETCCYGTCCDSTEICNHRFKTCQPRCSGPRLCTDGHTCVPPGNQCCIGTHLYCPLGHDCCYGYCCNPGDYCSEGRCKSRYFDAGEVVGIAASNMTAPNLLEQTIIE